uniref:Peptidase C1A papain C-terminal domain-containing protein n=1 Tax=Entomoneis paludosa TaxID=265537 RepID=A0A7S2YNG2_9STRA|mmetsp:Transcript_4039/g.8653  ORF Transcript_4039/g.8653 Transcript_4039/m.8653 type:complete len:360 (+) Transcript_4039:86-1165(+)|eukprot:CAMPEP_0172448072 /NCGR_PEP_ID=MMETSP1065-20121228/7163_1 /TAXON_ID=265537 /ORGANISM="Amphiprora paludosa, Strain CCMP125" /LENGTH=359 /DNA_ID=CAMNT_0013199459 /DNA_START=29 /DNA_END=1108 /DNA_ORIENTATION=-
MMKMIKTTLLMAVLAMANAEHSHTTVTNIEEELHGLELMAKFKSWMDQHTKSYDTHASFQQRLTTWMDNNAKIEEHNAQKDNTAVLGHNEFSDMTQDEFHRHFKLGQYSDASKVDVGRRRTQETVDKFQEMVPLTLPDYINWIQLGGVTKVKNQGSCGSCWAFSTTGSLEGAKFIKTGELVALSEQNLLDCDHEDLGCNGGLMDNAFKFDEKAGGLCSEADYPYMARQGKTCMTNCTDVPGSLVKTFIDVPPGDEKALVSAVAMQPISVAIEASQFAFQFYKTGVITDNSCGRNGNIDHGVLAVGYGSDLETGSPYFLVKNSWGGSWGEDGYVKLGRGGTSEFGICAILKMASFPVTEV